MQEAIYVGDEKHDAGIAECKLTDSTLSEAFDYLKDSLG